jgi:lipoprotein-anchoring transpeptidase ErfK/SrfK
MADIFVRPYDQQHKPPTRLIVTALIVLAVTLALTGLWIWLDSRPVKAAEEKPAVQPVPAAPVAPSAPAVPVAPAAPAVASPDSRAQQLFTRAQSLVNSGNLEQASELLGQVVSISTDENLKNNAMRVQGRVNVKLFLSPAPTPEKKHYIIQPGDSLDKIARLNKTTVDLIRKMNKIDGNLIYPGQKMLIPAAPFVVEVDKSSRTLDLTMNGKLFKRYVVTLGLNGKTPAGHFVTVVHQTNPDWTPPGGGTIPFGDPRNVLGTRWISIQDTTRPEIKGFGIHGTANPESIGTETSNGCVRMVNEEVEELYLLIPRGTDVMISE